MTIYNHHDKTYAIITNRKYLKWFSEWLDLFDEVGDNTYIWGGDLSKEDNEKLQNSFTEINQEKFTNKFQWYITGEYYGE